MKYYNNSKDVYYSYYLKRKKKKLFNILVELKDNLYYKLKNIFTLEFGILSVLATIILIFLFLLIQNLNSIKIQDELNSLTSNRNAEYYAEKNILTVSAIKDIYYSAGGVEILIQPVNFFTYIVKKNDTLWSIAKKFKISVDSIYSCNKLKSPHYLKVGTKLVIPDQTGILKRIRNKNDLQNIKDKFGIDDLSLFIANKVSSEEELIKKGNIFLPNVELPFDEKLKTYGIDFGLPTYGLITSGFGYRRDPFTGRRRFHTGLDIANFLGTRIRAAYDGVVVFAGRKGGYGLCIIIKHPLGYTTLYGHLYKIYVRKGMFVRKGAVIGLMGSTGRSTGPHLHFEIRKFGALINPSFYIKGLPYKRRRRRY